MSSTLVALMFSGYSLGGMLSAGLGIYILPRFGWQAMFYAAAIPLLLLPFIMWKLPESVGFLLRQGENQKARDLLAKVDPTVHIPADTQLVAADAKGAGVPMLDLVKEGRAAGTFLIWVAFFCCLLMVYALGSWLPKLMAGAGYSLGSSLSFLLALLLCQLSLAGFGGGGWLVLLGLIFALRIALLRQLCIAVQHIECHVKCCQHGHALARAHLARVAHTNHGFIDAADGLHHAFFLTIGAGQHIALLHDLHIDLLHGRQWRVW